MLRNFNEIASLLSTSYYKENNMFTALKAF